MNKTLPLRVWEWFTKTHFRAFLLTLLFIAAICGGFSLLTVLISMDYGWYVYGALAVFWLWVISGALVRS